MSGTSLDGIDVAYCTFSFTDRWTFSLQASQTIPYSAAWTKKLKAAHTLSAESLQALDVEYGTYLGSVCKKFIATYKIKDLHFIASHGHTVFHQPEKRFTLQIGNGNALYAELNTPVINDFRSLDVARGGEGAPLVPIGDKLLFHEYDVCLNLGGIANLSEEHKNKRIAFDVCFLNMALNYLAQKGGKKFDAAGTMASKGEVNQNLLKKLDKVYISLNNGSPSLGREIFEKRIQPLLDSAEISIQDKLRTVTESCAKEIVNNIVQKGKKPTVLCTGGGTFNSFLIYRMVELLGDDATLIIPEADIVNFKEAIVFAFLGVLRVRNEANCLKSVTGASQDSSGGVMVGF